MDFLYSLFKLYTGESHIASAAPANDADITADSHDGKALFTAGMGLFKLKHVADGDPDDVCHGLSFDYFHSYLNYNTNGYGSKEIL